MHDIRKGVLLKNIKTKPTIKGYFIKHYLLLIPLSIIFILIGLYIILTPIILTSILGLILIILALFLIAGALIHCKLHCDATSIYFDEDKLVYETGIIKHYKKKIPLHMITDSSLTRSFIEIIFGLATLNISTSGRSGYEIICDGLNYAETEKTHIFLYEKIKKNKKIEL